MDKKEFSGQMVANRLWSKKDPHGYGFMSHALSVGAVLRRSSELKRVLI